MNKLPTDIVINTNYALPSSYSDALSYYEEICKFRTLLVNTINGLNSLIDLENNHYTELKQTDTNNYNELDELKENKEFLTNNRKLSTDGNFTGSWWGIDKPVHVEGGIDAIVEQHTGQIDNLNINVNTNTTNLNNIINKRKIDLTYYKEQGLDLVTVIENKISEGYTWFILPRFTRFNRTLNIKDRTSPTDGGIIFEGSGMIETDIELNTGGIGIKISGCNRINFKNCSLTSINMPTPSTIGILYERSANNDVCQWNNLSNVFIKMHHDPSANNNHGTIGLYNDTAELCDYHNLISWADSPVVITRDDIFNIGVTKRSLSMKCITFSGMTSLISMRYKPLVLDAVSDVVFENLYCTKDLYTDYANNNENYAILITGTSNSGYENYCINFVNLDVETFSATIDIQAKVRFLTLRGNHQNATLGHLIRVTSSNGQLTSSDIKMSMINKSSSFPLIDLVLFENTCLGASSCIFYTTNTQQITTYKTLSACEVIGDNAPTIVKNHSFAQTVFSKSTKGYGLNNNFMNWTYAVPSGSGNAGDIFFNQNQGSANGNPVGYVYTGTDYSTFGQVGYRTTTSSPIGVLTPKQVGEWILDTTNKIIYDAVGTTNNDWKARNV